MFPRQALESDAVK